MCADDSMAVTTADADDPFIVPSFGFASGFVLSSLVTALVDAASDFFAF